jgi:hypothetical protein
MHTDFMIVAPSQRPLSSEAQLFIEQFKAEMSCLERRGEAQATSKRGRPARHARPPVTARA